MTHSSRRIRGVQCYLGAPFLLAESIAAKLNVFNLSVPLIVLVGACGGDSRSPANSPGQVIHPIADSLESSITKAPVVQLQYASKDSLQGIYAALQHFVADSAIGEHNEPAHLVFGSIVDATATITGAVGILDSQYGRLRLVNGGSVTSRGSLGDGPGELVEPVGVLSVTPDTFAVVDAEGRRLQFFTASNDGDAGRRTVPLVAFDACFVNGNLFVAGPRTQQDSAGAVLHTKAFVHQVDDAGRITRSISVPYRSANLTLAYTYGVAKLACDSREGGHLWVAYSALGEVHALQPDGSVLWIARVNDLKFPSQIESGNVIGSDPAHALIREHIANITLISDTVLAIQVQSRTRPDLATRTWINSFRTYLIHTRDGRSLGAFSADHQIVGAGGGKVVLYREDPYPQIQIVYLRR